MTPYRYYGFQICPCRCPQESRWFVFLPDLMAAHDSLHRGQRHSRNQIPESRRGENLMPHFETVAAARDYIRENLIPTPEVKSA